MLEINKAKNNIGYLKVGVYGQSGSGKTYTSLKVASELVKMLNTKLLVFDTEHGTDFYSSEFEFDVVYTRDINDLLEFFTSDNYKEYGIVLIDSLTHFWDEIQDKYIESLAKSNNPKKKERGLTGELQFQDWRFIKKPYKKFMSLMLASPKHVFFTTREATDYKMEHGELVVVGSKMRAERETQYEPSIIIRMQLMNGDNIAVVEKDRSNTIQNKMFRRPDFNMFKPVIEKLGLHNMKVKEIENMATTDIEVLQEFNIIVSEYSNKIGKDKEQVVKSILSTYNVEDINDLDEVQLTEAISRMKKILQSKWGELYVWKGI